MAPLALGCKIGQTYTENEDFLFVRVCVFQKNPRVHKNKIGTSPPPPNPKYSPPKTRNFMDIGFPAERTHFFQAPIKLAQPFPAPELRTRLLRTRGFFWVFMYFSPSCQQISKGPFPILHGSQLIPNFADSADFWRFSVKETSRQILSGFPKWR